MDEFWCIWMESSDGWLLVYPNGQTRGPFPAVGYAVNAAYMELDAKESDFDCTENSGDAYHYEASEERLY